MSLVPWLVASPWIAVVFVVVYRFVTRTPRLRDYEPLTSGPLVSVIIPARNEARNIERCVRSVLATAYAPLEVIVVDDRSTDGTAGIVEPATGGRLRLVRGTDPPAGWFGKQWAIIQGYRVARGELLLFTDADTKHEPELLPRAFGNACFTAHLVRGVHRGRRARLVCVAVSIRCRDRGVHHDQIGLAGAQKGRVARTSLRFERLTHEDVSRNVIISKLYSHRARSPRPHSLSRRRCGGSWPISPASLQRLELPGPASARPTAFPESCRRRTSRNT